MQNQQSTLRQADSRATASLYDVDKSFQESKDPIPLSYRSQSNTTARGFTARQDETLTSREKSKISRLHTYIHTYIHNMHPNSYLIYSIRVCW